AMNLDALIARARAATVDRAEAERYVRELERWARPAPRRWVPWLAAGLAAAAIAIAVVRLAGRAEVAVAAVAPVQVGDRVTIVAEPAAAYRLVRAGADDT